MVEPLPPPAPRPRRSDRPLDELLLWVTDFLDPRALEGETDPEPANDAPAIQPGAWQNSRPALCPHNLDDFRYPFFVGRREALAAVLEALQQERLVTLVGMGGVGKTSLAVEVAERLIFDGDGPESARFPDGVWMVPLEDLDRKSSRSEHVLWERLAAQLGIPNLDATVGSTADVAVHLEETVQGFLRGKRVLLILDNCEHLHRKALIGFASALCSQSDSDIRLLATSRVPLGLERYERVLDLDVLIAPPPQAVPAALWQNEAVELFVSRAGRSGLALISRPGEPRSDAQVCCIAQICRRIDCLPLAIVLVASRAPLYPSLEDLETDLDRVLEEETRAADVPDRQRTLEKTLAWSYNLLERPEPKQLLRQLAVFRGGFTLADVTEVCPVCQGDPARATRLLLELHEARLVVRRPDQPLYRFLETIYRFAWKRFLKDAQREETEQGHVAHFLGLFVASLSALSLGEAPSADTFLTVHETNVVAALERSAANPGELGKQVVWKLEETLPDPGASRTYPLFRRLYPFAVASRPLAAAVEEPDLPPAPGVGKRWLRNLHRGLAVQELFAGEGDWEALFGGKEPSFKTLRESLENQQWQDESLCTLTVLANMQDLSQARLMFACMYFIAFDWWDAYYQPDSKCEYLLDAWARHHPDDPVEAALRAFSQSYPSSSEWKDRAGFRPQWSRAAECLHEAQRLLRIAVPATELKTKVQRYLRAITNRYLAECLHYTALGRPSLPQGLLQQVATLFRPSARSRKPAADAPAPPGPWELFEEAQRLFRRDKDRFNDQWVTWQYADALQEAGECDAARGQCRTAFDSEWDELKEEEELTRDTMDLEVLNNLYRVMGDLLTREGAHEAALLHHAAALFMAYTFLYTERDGYALALYREAFERLQACLGALVDGKPRERQAFVTGAPRLQALWSLTREPGSEVDLARDAQQPGWRQHVRTHPEELAAALFPPVPESVEALDADGDFCAAIAAAIERMPDHLAHLQAGPLKGVELPYRFPHFCVMLAEAPDAVAEEA